MAVTTLDEKTMARVRELRRAGSSPKQIARAVGARPSVIGSAVRTVAAQDAAARTEPELVGCWVSPGWSAGLAVDGHPAWPDVDDPGPGRTGMATVAVARQSRPSRVSLAGFLVDTFCLGVKDTFGPREMSESRLPEFRLRFFAAFAELGEPHSRRRSRSPSIWSSVRATLPGGGASSRTPSSRRWPATSGPGSTKAPSPSARMVCRSTCKARTTRIPPASCARWIGPSGAEAEGEAGESG
jgi:hypothetical protein